jgi:hypothetical protein
MALAVILMLLRRTLLLTTSRLLTALVTTPAALLLVSLPCIAATALLVPLGTTALLLVSLPATLLVASMAAIVVMTLPTATAMVVVMALPATPAATDIDTAAIDRLGVIPATVIAAIAAIHAAGKRQTKKSQGSKPNLFHDGVYVHPVEWRQCGSIIAIPRQKNRGFPNPACRSAAARRGG